jgi:outer membrane protein assembly factor BamB
MQVTVMPRFIAAIASLLVFVSTSALAQGIASPLIDQTTAARHGLRRSWFAQIPLGHVGRMVDLKHDGGTLFVQTSGARTMAIEAETGRVLWSADIGSPAQPALPLGISDDHVAAINGTTLFVLDRKTGQVEFTRRLTGTPNNGAALSEQAVFVPNMGGQLETYTLIEEDHHSLTNVRMEGRHLTQPAVSFLGVGWGSGRGDFGLAKLDGTGLIFREPTNFPIVAAPAARGPALYFGNTGGYLYAFDSISGRERWSFATGHSISQTPAPFPDAIYVVCDDGTMYRVNAETGKEDWAARRVKHLLAVTPTRVYTTDQFGRLAVLSPRSGATLDVMPLPPYAMHVSNYQSDRIFLAGARGLVQALHEIELNQPLDYRPEKPKPPAAKERPTKAKTKAKDDAPAEETAAPTEEAPKGKKEAPAADPFGAGAGEGGGEADPFK